MKKTCKMTTSGIHLWAPEIMEICGRIIYTGMMKCRVCGIINDTPPKKEKK